MRHVFPLFLVFGWIAAHAAGVTPAEARAGAAKAQETLATLNYYLVDDYFHHGDFDRAVVMLDRVIALNPIGTDTYATAAWLLWSSKKTERAIDFINRMVAANPNNAMACYEAGIFYFRLKNDDEAARWFGKAVKLGLPSPQRHYYGITLERMGRLADALAFWRKLLVVEPHDQMIQRHIKSLSEKLAHPAPKPAPQTKPAPEAKGQTVGNVTK